MLVGDGMDATIITGNLNVIDGSTTFKSATVGKYLISHYTLLTYLFWSNKEAWILT